MSHPRQWRSCVDMSSWYVLKTKPRQEKAVRNVLRSIGVEHFLPTTFDYHYYGHGRKKKIEQPVLPTMLFVKVDADIRFELINSIKYDVHYLVDRNTNSSMTIPDRQMDDFKLVCNVPDIKLECVEYAVGDRVTIQSGGFAGMQGFVSRVNGRNRFVIVLDGLANIAVDLPIGRLDFEEKMYSVGKIPGGYKKREGRPADKAKVLIPFMT